MELGCGPALHTIGLARSGVPSCTGVDLNDQMLRYARWRYDRPGRDAAEASGGTGGGGGGGGKGGSNGKPSAGQKAGKGFSAAAASSSTAAGPPSGGESALELVKGDMASFELKVGSLLDRIHSSPDCMGPALSQNSVGLKPTPCSSGPGELRHGHVPPWHLLAHVGESGVGHGHVPPWHLLAHVGESGGDL